MKPIDEFVEAGCELSMPREKLSTFIGIYDLTHGDPCTTGCAFFKNGNCEAYRKLFPNAPKRAEPKTKLRTQASQGYAQPTKKPFRW